jgi:sortase (surface protein transpeptidase)
MVVVGAVHGSRGADVDVGAVPPVAPLPAAAPAPAPFWMIAPSAPATAAPVAADPPVRLRIPALRVDVPVVAVDVGTDRALGVPDDPDVVGWWRDGSAPGGPVGSVVLDGHVDTYDKGPGALFRLAALRPGDAVQLVLPDGTADYRIAAVRSYVKADLPADVFDRAGAPRLVLISCGGPFDRALRSYRDNIVVYGVPSGRP